jgi:hypothetical protein
MLHMKNESILGIVLPIFQISRNQDQAVIEKAQVAEKAIRLCARWKDKAVLPWLDIAKL